MENRLMTRYFVLTWGSRAAVSDARPIIAAHVRCPRRSLSLGVRQEETRNRECVRLFSSHESGIHGDHRGSAGGGYWAICPEVPGANGQGETVEETKQNLIEAIELILEDRRLDIMRGLPDDVIR